MKVLVLMGGTSAERPVSVNTGQAVAEGLKEAGHHVRPYDLGGRDGDDFVGLINSPALQEAEAVFIALHGGQGEDGRVQAVLDLIGKPYTGSGVRASAICMDKAVSKIILEHKGISTPPWACLGRKSLCSETAGAAVRGLGGLPVVVKPVDQGSTIGISIVERWEDLDRAIALALEYSGAVLFEAYISGRELSVPVIEDEVYPIVEIKPKEGFYDYERKYTKGMTSYECPACLEEGLYRRIEMETMKAYTSLGCEGFGRVDLRLGDDGTPYFLEVNTIPGMTETSLVPMGAKARGLSFSRLVDRIVRYAVRKTAAGNSNVGG
jgi:D-alanine-D-alanine ligase